MRRTAGQTSQLTAKATFADGTTQDVTTTGATWYGITENVGSVSTSGLVTAVGLGQVAVHARYGSLLAVADIFILPSGTFKLSGEVHQPGFLLPGARVEILDGPSAGQSRESSKDSYYEFYGLSGDLRVRASKPGYQSETKSVSMTQHQKLDFTLTPLLVSDVAMFNGIQDEGILFAPRIVPDSDRAYTLGPLADYTVGYGIRPTAPGHCIFSHLSLSWELKPQNSYGCYKVRGPNAKQGQQFTTPETDTVVDPERQMVTIVVEERLEDGSVVDSTTITIAVHLRN